MLRKLPARGVGLGRVACLPPPPPRPAEPSGGLELKIEVCLLFFYWEVISGDLILLGGC